jgi:hypothetical protein
LSLAGPSETLAGLGEPTSPAFFSILAAGNSRRGKLFREKRLQFAS